LSELANAATLRHVLIKMEDSLGLKDLSPSERDVYYAAVTLSETSGKIVKSEDIRTHESLTNMPLPTLYRSLSELVKKSYLCHPEGTKRGLFSVA
jgi:hypothetical protein